MAADGRQRITEALVDTVPGVLLILWSTFSSVFGERVRTKATYVSSPATLKHRWISEISARWFSKSTESTRASVTMCTSAVISYPSEAGLMIAV